MPISRMFEPCSGQFTFTELDWTLSLTLSLVDTVMSQPLIAHVTSVWRSQPLIAHVTVSSLYSPQKDFTCLDGSATLPFIYVNDDYCDCDDGSDEPGTPACPNETFHCTNAGHRPLNIPSSRVNDGICGETSSFLLVVTRLLRGLSDCCDASDEYSSRATCLNNCPELGRAARAEAIKLLELTKLGNTLRLELSKKGRTIKQETQERVRQLEADQQEADSVREEKETLKRAAEEAESRVLEQYRRVEEEERQRETEKLAFEQFHRLDSNQDGRLETAEITTQTMFDQNKDGAVSEEEVKVTSVRSVEDTCVSTGLVRVRILVSRQD
uniref:Glucosidase II beta subunit N-terminal domain-containing protein n=1 Tax=Timema douglasi TaxID=61478 RepID=A0A7R8ZH31_TIMDO|nr:unnamed protein product [Timema douglasi]